MASKLNADEVVALIYRGATATASWDPALSAMVDLFAASTACFRISMRGAHPFELRYAAGPKIRRDVLLEWEKTQRGVELSPPPKLGKTEVFRFADEFPDDPVTKELLEYDTAFALAHCFESIDGAEYVISISRGLGDPEFGPSEFEAIQRIGHHFREAVRIRREMIRSSQTSQFQGQVLDRLGIAGILLDPFGAVLPLNAGAEQILASMNCLKLQRFDRLIAINRAADKELQKHIKSILSGAVPEGTTFAMSLERSDGGRPVGMLISSARTVGLAPDREQNYALLLLRDSEPNFAIESALVQKLFSFTPAEASVAIGLAAGHSLDEIEGRMHIRHNTARAHLRSIFVKADVSRQAELVCLLTNSIAPLAQSARKHLNN